MILKHDFLIKDARFTTSYHFRSIIPKDLIDYFNGRTSFTISLRTGIYKDARSISFLLYYITQSIFEQIRMGELDLDIDGIKEILKVEIGRSVKHSQYIKFDSQYSDIKKYESLLKNAIEKKNFDKEDQSLIEKVDARIEQHMKNLGYKSTKKSLQFKQLRAQFIELWYLRHELKQELLESKEGSGIDEMFFQKCNEKFNMDLPVSPPSSTVQTVKISTTEKPKEIIETREQIESYGELISEVKPKFIQFWSRRDNKPKTVLIYKTTIKHFIDIIGDIPIDAITSKTVFEYKEKFLQIPNRREQNPKYAGKTIAEILEMNPSELEEFESRGMHTLNQSLRRLSTFANWCCGNTAMTQNPFANATEKNLKKTVTEKNWTDAEVSRLFEPKVFLSSSIFFNGNQPNRHCNFLVPLIMLFTGARVNEVCQLHISDIERVRHKEKNDYFWIIDFNSNECDCCPPEHRKSIKNKSSHRRIPLHPSLLEVGLIRYRNILEKKGETRLFPKNNFQTKGGWSSSFSHWWNVTYLPKLGLKNLKNRKTDTHTFRHTCLNKMKQNGAEEGLAMEYAGHHHSNMTFTTYSDRYDPSILKDRILDKIHFKGLDVRKLNVNWSQIFKNPTKDQLGREVE